MPFICLLGVFEPDSAAVSPLQLTSGIYVCRLFRLDRLSITNPSSRFPVLQFGAEFSTLVISSPACSVSQSCDFQSCSSVPSFPLSWFPVLQFGAEFSTLTISGPAVQSRSPAFSSPAVQSRSPAFSSPVVWCRIFQSRVFSSPGNSNAYVNKVTLCLELGWWPLLVHRLGT